MADKAENGKDNNEYGHRKMIVWKNIDEIEKQVNQKILKYIPKTQFNLRDQIDRACDSVGANFIEGYYSGSIKEYMRFLKYSKRSLAELQGWLQKCLNKGFIDETLFREIDVLTIRTMYLMNRLINALRIKSTSFNKD
jgi:four helix bundle protein